MTRFRLELYDRAVTPLGFTPIPAPEIISDYLTLKPTTVEVAPTQEVQRGWFARIMADDTPVFHGVVTGVDEPKVTKRITIAPLLSLLDVEIHVTPSAWSGSTAAETLIVNQIKALYVNSGDSVQNLPVTASATTTTVNVPLEPEKAITGFYGLISAALTGGQIYVNAEINPSDRTLDFTVRKNTAAAVTIESDRPTVAERTFALRDDYGAVNKVIVYNADNASQSATFYADGYAAPTVWAITEIKLNSGESFATKAAEVAAQKLALKDFSNLVELTVSTADRLIPPMNVGQKVNIIRGGETYASYYTGSRRIGDRITHIFGGVRLDLSDIKRLEARKK